MHNDLPSLFVIVFIGLITSYEDIKSGKIRNKWIIIGLLFGLLISGLNAAFKEMYPGIMLPNISIAVLVAYLLWKFGLWSAGDGKLFIAYSLLMPLLRYKEIYFNYFPAFTLLLNIFLPATLFLFSKAILDFFKGNSYSEIKDSLRLAAIKSKNDFLIVFSGFGTVFLFNQILRNKLVTIFSNVVPERNVALLLMLAAYKPLFVLYRKKKTAIMVISALALIYLVLQMLTTGYNFIWSLLMIVRMTVLVMAIFAFFRFVTDAYIDKQKAKTWPFAIWMFLGALITWMKLF
ncbi:MAG: hypothetical protein FJZ13_00775 [Candidatus Omnitrophica bacterium]|nr:hypothetical protein [Candidatus Omnitrophota bacterium]